MNRSELDIILKGISLKFRPYVSVVYISGDELDAGRILRSFYLLKGFQSKGLMTRYGDALFLITTSALDDHESHYIIRREAFELLGIPEETAFGMSDVHENSALDKAFRESLQCYIASVVCGERFDDFTGTAFPACSFPLLKTKNRLPLQRAYLALFQIILTLWKRQTDTSLPAEIL